MSKEESTSKVEPENAVNDIASVSRITTVPAILKAVAELTGMRYVVIARVTDDRWVACAVLDEMDFGLPPGGELEVATTLCSEVRERGEPIVIGHASADTVYCGHPTPKKYGIESYIAVPIVLKNGEFFGTLCAVDSRPVDLSRGIVVESMKLFADLVANELGNEQTYAELLDSETLRRESENRVRAVTDAMPGLISYMDAGYRYRFVNHAYTEWFGLNAKDIIGKPLWEVLGVRAFESLKPHVDLALAGKSEVFETEIPYRLGGTRFIRASYTPDIYEGKVRGMFVLVVDITKERQAQEAVRRSEEQYRAFIRNSTEAIWRFELDQPIPIDLPTDEQVELTYRYGYLAECNDTMARQYGFRSADEIVGMRLTDLLVADDPKNVEFVRSFIESGYSISDAESHEKGTDGEDRYFINNFVGIVEDGHLVRVWGTQRDVTQAKLADEATARLAAIVISSDDAIISKDLMGNITSWNIGATKMFGYEPEEMIGKPITMLTPPERIDESAEILRRIRREENVEHFETVRRRKDGTDIIVSLTVSPIRNAEGNVVGASKIVRDITERKRIEESINQNQAMLALAMQSSRMGVWDLDLATNTVSWSEELEAIFGLPRGGFGGTEEHFFALMHEDDREEAWREVRAAIEEHRSYSIEFRFHHADGSVRWMEGRGQAVYSQKGEPVRLYGVGIDVTERMAADRALRESERRFSRFMQQLPGLAWIKDLEGRYVYANESAERSFGVSGDKLYGRTDAEIFPPETAEQFRTHDRRALESGSRGIQITESLVADDGVLHYSIVNKFPIAGADGKPAMIGGMAIDVTDQKHAEEALRRSEETYRTLFESIDEGFCIAEVIFDDEGKPIDYRFEQANIAFFKLTGFPPEAVGRTVRELVPDIEQHWIDTLGHVASTGIPARFENEARSMERWFDIFVSRIGDAGNRVSVVFSNITDRKRREANLAFLADWQLSFASMLSVDEIVEATARRVGEYLGASICTLVEIDSDMENAHVLKCHAAEGVSPLEGDYRIADYHTAEELERLKAGLELAVNDVAALPRSKNSVQSFESIGIGSLLNAPYLSDGRLLFVLSVAHREARVWRPDEIELMHELASRIYARIERARSEEAVRRSEESILRAERKATEDYQELLARIVPLAATLGRSRDLTSIYRSVGDFIRASMPCSGFFVSFFNADTSTRQAAYVWGDGEEVDISELPPMRLTPEGGGANSRAVFEKRTIITDNYWDDMKKRPHVVVREDGRDPMSSLIVPMILKDVVLGTLEVQAYENGAFHQEHAVALEMAANLAAVAIENVRLIETEAAMREAAEAANRAKDEFLSVLSHELRTPLNAMLGWVRMLKAGVLDEENSERALEVIERNTRLQGSLIEDLLDVSRIISGKMRIETELVDLVSIVETVSETIRPLAEAKEIGYRFTCDEEAVFLTADPVRMQQVISNLLQNSIKFTPSGGRVGVSIGREGTNAILSVEDTGVGIEPELLPFIFDRFRQADASARRNFTGLGLGLTIVRNIVELHRGTIDVRSDGRDKGSTFTLTLPLAADFYDNLDLELGVERAGKGLLAGKTILLVDDDTENLVPLKIFLENEQARVTPAASAKEAMMLLADYDFHLLITDIGMPEIDGYELVSRIRAKNGRNASLKAIALTAYASVDDRERALKSGFQAHLAKPVNFEELLATIERVTRNGG